MSDSPENPKPSQPPRPAEKPAAGGPTAIKPDAARLLRPRAAAAPAPKRTAGQKQRPAGNHPNQSPQYKPAAPSRNGHDGARRHLIYGSVVLAGIFATGMFIIAGFAIYGLVILPNARDDAEVDSSALAEPKTELATPRDSAVASNPSGDVLPEPRSTDVPPRQNDTPNASLTKKGDEEKEDDVQPASRQPFHPPAAAAHPFQDIVARGSQLPLPPLSKSVGANPKEVELAKIFVDTPDQCELALIGTDVVFGSDNRGGIQFQPNKTAGSWEAFSSVTNEFGQDEKRIDGVFTIRDESLYFKWGNKTPNTRLKFCLLQIKSGATVVKCSLFEPETIEPLRIDPEQSESTTPIPVVGIGNLLDRLLVEFRLDGFPPHHEFPKPTLPVNEATTITLFEKAAADQNYKLGVEPIAKIDVRLSAEEDKNGSFVIPLSDLLPVTETGKFSNGTSQPSSIPHVRKIQQVCKDHIAEAQVRGARLNGFVKGKRSAVDKANLILGEKEKKITNEPMKPQAPKGKRNYTTESAWYQYDKKMAAYNLLIKRREQELAPYKASKQRAEAEYNEAQQNLNDFETLLGLAETTDKACDELIQQFSELAQARIHFKVFFEIDGQQIVLIRSDETAAETSK